MKKFKNIDLKKTIKFLKEFMNLSRKQQLDIISKFERKVKEDV